MLLIVQETHTPLLQAVTVKNAAINQDSSVKYTKMGVRLVEKIVHLVDRAETCPWNSMPVKERVVGSYFDSTKH